MISKIEAVIKKVLGKEVKFSVTASEKPEFGHYSTNAAFFVKGDPQKLADEIRQQAKNFFEKVEAKGKFINFWISKGALLNELGEVLKYPPSLRKAELRKGKQKICLEFISANPTGPLTMANGRGGFLGDVLANVLERVGHKVTREYYINDAGNQIKLLGESVLAALGKAEPKDTHYQGNYIKELAGRLNKELRIKNYGAEEVGRLAAAELLKEIKKSLKNVNIDFDIWFSEYQNLHKKGELKKVLETLEKNGLVSKREGAKWLPGHVFGKSDGQPTYFLADLAYHYDKFIKRKFDCVIDIWGADHHGYIDRLKTGVKALGVNPDKLKIIITQLVRLVENGKEVRMSKRAGEFVTLDELVKEVGKDATRFFFLMHAPETHMDFDLALAKEKSQKNPVYYVQYAFVRCGAILRKAKLKRIKNYAMPAGRQELRIKNLESESELNLMRELVKLPDVVLQTAEDCQVSRVARYASELARAFHNFYEKERVIVEEKELTEARLALVSATQHILGEVLSILGINQPAKM